jgi:hypothetical protein
MLTKLSNQPISLQTLSGMSVLLACPQVASFLLTSFIDDIWSNESTFNKHCPKYNPVPMSVTKKLSLIKSTPVGLGSSRSFVSIFALVVTSQGLGFETIDTETVTDNKNINEIKKQKTGFCQKVKKLNRKIFFVVKIRFVQNQRT